MADDLTDEFQPWAETRKRILKESDLLIRVTDVWAQLTQELIDRNALYWTHDGDPQFLTDAVPIEYRGLSELLIFWCDNTPKFSIDPTAISDLVSWVEHVDLLLKLGATPANLLKFLKDRDEFGVIIDRAYSVISRIRSAATVSQDLEPPRKTRGRRGDPRVAMRRKEVLKRHKRKIKPGEIAAQLLILQQKGILPKDLPIGVVVVRQDIRRA